MSFLCEFCRKTAPGGTPERKIVVKTRVRPGDGGEETVREKSMCEPCWAKGETDVKAN